MKKVIVLISDECYLDGAKSLFYNAKNEGKWDGDFCLIANNLNNYDLSDLKKFGVNILHKNNKNEFKVKLNMFDVYFKRWDYVIYMDIDFMVFKDFNLFLNKYDTSSNNLIVDVESHEIHEYLCQGHNSDNKENSLRELHKKYDLNKLGFNSGFISFNTKIINDETLTDLLKLDEEIKYVNNHVHPNGGDQPIFNLYFTDIHYIENHDISNSVIIRENTIASHFCGGYKPWAKDEFSPIFGKTYKEKYYENLNGFYEYINNL